MNVTGSLAWGISIGIVLIIIGLEVVLSRQKNVFWGIIPIFLIFMSLTGLGACMKNIQDDNKEFLTTYHFNNGMTAEVKILENNNRIVAYSHISIKNLGGQLIDVEPFFIENDKAISRYTEASNYFYEKYDLTGASEDVKMINNEMIRFNGVNINANFLFLAAFILNLPLTVILIIMRKYIEQQRIASEIKRLNFAMRT